MYEGHLVNLVVIMHVVESHASWCMGFSLISVCSGPMIGIGSEYPVSSGIR